MLLGDSHYVEPSSVHVRFLRFGPSSLDLAVFAYVLACNGPSSDRLAIELIGAGAVFASLGLGEAVYRFLFRDFDGQPIAFRSRCCLD